MDSDKLFLFGGLGLGAYLLYRWYQGQPAAAAVGVAVVPAAGAPAESWGTYPFIAAGGTKAQWDGMSEADRAKWVIPGATPSPSPTGITLDQMYYQLIAETANNPAFTGSGDGRTANLHDWNWYVLRLSLPTSLAGSDPMMAAFGGKDWSQTYTAAQVWAGLSAFLRSKGMSGLGFYSGLGALAGMAVQ